MHLGPYFSYVPYHFPYLISMSPYSLCVGSGTKSILSTRNHSRLNAILEGFLKTTQDLVADLRAHLHLNADPIAQLRGVNTQVTTDDPVEVVTPCHMISLF